MPGAACRWILPAKGFSLPGAPNHPFTEDHLGRSSSRVTGGDPVPGAEIMGVLVFLYRDGCPSSLRWVSEFAIPSSLFATELMPDLAHAVDAEVVVLNQWGRALFLPFQTECMNVNHWSQIYSQLGRHNSGNRI